LAEALGLELQESAPETPECGSYVEVEESGAGYCLGDVVTSDFDILDVGHRLRGSLPTELDRQIFALSSAIDDAYEAGDSAAVEALIPQLNALLQERDQEEPPPTGATGPTGL
jgi:hypothetical protein